MNNADQQWATHLIDVQRPAEAIENSKRESMRVVAAVVQFICYMEMRSVWIVALVHMIRPIA